MKINEELTISKMFIGGIEVEVPHGLVELLNASGAWEYEENKSIPNPDYERSIKRTESGLVTYLKYKGQKKKVS